MTKNWDENFSFGSGIENFIRDYFEEIMDWKFIAGAYDGKILNPDNIEWLFGCEYLPAGKYNDGFHGPRIQFENTKPLIMPDQLYRSKNNIYFWVESKGRKFFGQKSALIEYEKLLDYVAVAKITKKTMWIVLSLVDEKDNEINIYSCTNKQVEDYLKKNYPTWDADYGCEVIKFPISFFNKINRSKLSYK